MALLSCFTISSSIRAGEWTFVPDFSINETFTDNLELITEDKESSLVSQAIIGLNLNYQSRLASFSFSGSNNNLFYSHDSDLNDNYLTLATEMQSYLWTSGPELIASAQISNTSGNSANNELADLISGDTIQSENYSTGLRYNVHNNDFSIQSSLIYSINDYEDDIGENNDVSAIFNTSSGENTHFSFWQISTYFSKRNQDFSGGTRSGKQYKIDASLGVKTPLDLRIFVRFYDEDFSGNSINQSQQTSSSLGPGFRWLVTPQFNVDFSYNYVEDDTVSDDYVTATLRWDPSARTSLNLGYSQRFFGNSYNLDIKHKTKRLTSSVSYTENLQVFDRGNFELVDLGQFWCPPSEDPTRNILQCIVSSNQPSNNDLTLTPFFSFEPIESNAFSLTKNFQWTSTLQLARTSFGINTAASRREGLESKIVDDSLSTSVTIDRKISGKSNLIFSASYNYLIFDKNNPGGSRQKDHYRTISATYTKNLAESLSTNLTIRHVNRSSNIDQYTYDEVRAIINVKKEF